MNVLACMLLIICPLWRYTESKQTGGNALVKFIYNEDAGYLEVPLHQLAKGVQYMDQQDIHHLKIIPIPKDTNHSGTKLDLAPLANKPYIYFLTIDEEIPLKKISLEPLYSLPHLRHLSLAYVKDRLDFSRLQGLHTLYITRADGEIELIDIPNLQHLLLAGTKNKDCRCLSSLSSLISLRISSSSIETLTGIDSLQMLESLQITHSPRLADLEGLNECTYLAELYIEKCKRITDYTVLKGNTSIRQLFLSDIQTLSFVPHMINLKTIRFWDVQDGELSFLLQSPTLEQVDFFPQKKKYTFTKEAINIALTNRDIPDELAKRRN